MVVPLVIVILVFLKNVPPLRASGAGCAEVQSILESHRVRVW